jgi:protein TonB
VHALILFLILAPIVGSSDFTHDPTVGGGGAGPAGGGGGGNEGPVSRQQHLQFVRVRSDPTVMPKVKPMSVPPVKPPEPKPQVESPIVPAPPTNANTTSATDVASGPGSAGTSGAGPGSGGGIGSGEGTGKGSSVGPGTGGGPGKDYPPTLRDLFIPPLPAPDKIKPYHLIAWFDVDEKGGATLIAFNPSKDGGYNKKLTEVLRSLRFRPGVHADGTPMRDTVDVHFIF